MFLQPETVQRRRARMRDRPPHNAGEPRRPGDRHSLSLLSQDAVLAQELQQFYQRQAEDRKMITLDPREKLRSPALDPVSSDRAEHGIPLGRNISGEKGFAQAP